jgi:DNA-binding transcriptional regulator LsrR (DeoR family)
MTNPYNKKKAEEARLRRAMFYRLHINKGLNSTELARRYGISRQRMDDLLKQAKIEANQPKVD